MKIACLQFAPQVGDVDNNLNRADSVLAKANPEDLEDLDLLVLPELAFTGYNFKSLNQISPFLEPSGSGISALWARTTALKYNANVVVGYPERVDVSAKWPTGPEYYSSSIVVNGDGETIANYRKSFLYVIDETWALEGKDGFFIGDIPHLGNTAMGICMDLNPYRFEAPWSAFEFAFHIVEMEANLVIVTMAWVTREDGRHFSRMPEDPDMETLTYWVQRLEPVIRAEGQDEVIVVFCNRTGTEDDLVYAGTSSVIGIKDGEVNVYGVLGRSVKDLLVVDTARGPFAKLVQRTEQESDATLHASGMPLKPTKPSAMTTSTLRESTEQSPKTRKGHRKPSPTPGFGNRSRKTISQSPRIQIPEYRHPDQLVVSGTPIDDSPGVATPTCPSPTPFHQRPNVASPDATSTQQFNSPLLAESEGSLHPHILNGHVILDQRTPSTASPVSGRAQEKYFWLENQPPLISPMESRFPNVYAPASTTIAPPVALVSLPLKDTNAPNFGSSISQLLVDKNDDGDGYDDLNQFAHPEMERQDSSSSKSHSDETQDTAPPRPPSPKSRNASRTGRQVEQRRLSMVTQPDLSGMAEKLEIMARRPGSAMESRLNATDEPRQGRPRGSRSTSRMGRSYGSNVSDEAFGHFSPTQIPFMASPGIFSDDSFRPQSDILRNREASLSRNAPPKGSPHWGRVSSRTNSFTSQGPQQPRARSNSNARATGDPDSNKEPDETRTLVWSELSKMVGEVLQQPEPRNVSRGRPRNASQLSSSDGMPNRDFHSAGSRPRVLPRTEQRFASQERSGSTPIRTIPAPDSTNGQTSPYNPDDEIVAEIIFHDRSSQAHTGNNSNGSQSNRATPNQSINAGSSPSVPKGMSRQINGTNTHQKSRDTTPQFRQKTSPRLAQEKRPSFHETFGEIKVYKTSTPSSTKSRPPSKSSCPNLDGSSTHTTATPKGSPATPSSRIFEPTTPKAMKLDPDFGTILSSASDPISNGNLAPLEAIENAVFGMDITRARSTVW